jgi:hypothetical protein
MAYGKLAEAARVKDFVPGNKIESADHNEIQDQLKVMLGPRQYSVLTDYANERTGNTWSFIMTTAGGYVNSTATNDNCIFPISLPAGCKITSITVEISSNAGASSAGKIELFYWQRGVNPTAQDLTAATADPWNTGGVAYANRATYTYTATTYTIQDNYHYAIYCAGPASGSDHRIWDVRFIAQFGN